MTPQQTARFALEVFPDPRMAAVQLLLFLMSDVLQDHTVEESARYAAWVKLRNARAWLIETAWPVPKVIDVPVAPSGDNFALALGAAERRIIEGILWPNLKTKE